MAVLPSLRGVVLAIASDLTEDEAVHGYYGRKVTMRVLSTKFIKDMVQPGTEIRVYLPVPMLTDGDEPFAVGDAVTCFAFPIPLGWEAEGFITHPEY